MKRLLVVALFMILMAFYATTTVASTSEESLSENVLKGNTSFAVQLYHVLGAAEGNLFFSPYSVSSALGMTYAGARGNTEKEMARVLHFNLKQTQLHHAFRRLNKELAANAQKNGQILNIANGLALTGSDVSQEYKSILKNSYDAEIFRGGLDPINLWVKQKTEGKIEKILEELSPNSVCVILNAIYFKGIWESQFKKSSTSDAPFFAAAEKKVTTSLMYQKNDFKLLEKVAFQAVSIPYTGNDLSMVILLPRTVDGLTALEKQLTTQNLKEWLGQLDNQRTQKVKVYLPKFKLETRYDLVKPFRSMGMKDAFTVGVADFSGMGWKKGDLWIGQIKHKAFVEVNEEGTEAAAATAVEMVTKSMQFDPVFRADHPFIFIIRDNTMGAILFMGRMQDPGNK